MNENKLAAAIADAENDVRARPNDDSAYLALGLTNFNASRYAEAKTALEKALAINPANAPAYEKIGHIHYVIDSPHQLALDMYEKAIAADPHFTITYYGIGILHATKTGDYQRAIEAFQRGLEANPGDHFLTVCLGSIYARMGQIDRGIAIIEAAAQSHPDQPLAYDWLNMLYLHQMRLEEAEKACRRALDLENSYDSHRLLGYIYDAWGRYPAAIAELEQALALEPEDYEARAALAKVYRMTGNQTSADHHYNLALAAATQDNEYGQACFYAVSGETEKALSLLEIGVAKGQVQPGWVRIDPEFAFIQQEPRFQALLR